MSLVSARPRIGTHRASATGRREGGDPVSNRRFEGLPLDSRFRGNEREFFQGARTML